MMYANVASATFVFFLSNDLLSAAAGLGVEGNENGRDAESSCGGIGKL